MIIRTLSILNFELKFVKFLKKNVQVCFHLFHNAKVTKSFLCYGQNIIMSEEGVQQGDPFGPLLFCLVIQPIINNITSPVNAWYLDYGSVGGAFDSVLEDLKKSSN